MEIMGLLFIVLIVTVIMMVYLTTTNPSRQSTKQTLYKTYSHNELSVSFINTLLETNVKNCGDITVRYLIVDCGTRNRVVCPGTYETSCEQLEDIITTIKNNTLDKWDMPYGLTINFTTTQEPIEYVKYNCTRNTVGRGSPGVFPINYYPTPGEAIIELGICG